MVSRVGCLVSLPVAKKFVQRTTSMFPIDFDQILFESFLARVDDILFIRIYFFLFKSYLPLV